MNADVYKVRNGKVSAKKISTKKLAVCASQDGGTKEQEIEPERQNRQALTDEQILQFEHMGRKIEEHFGHPQDIEWCLNSSRLKTPHEGRKRPGLELKRKLQGAWCSYRLQDAQKTRRISQRIKFVTLMDEQQSHIVLLQSIFQQSQGFFVIS